MSGREPDDWEPDEDDDPEDPEEELHEEELPGGRWSEDADDLAMDDCPSCGAEMLSEGARCPSCGEYVVAGSAPRRPFWIFATALALVILLGWTLIGC